MINAEKAKPQSNLVNREEFLKQFRDLLGCSKLVGEQDLEWLLPDVRKVIVEEMLIPTRGNQSKASNWLGINRGTLRSIVKSL